MRIVEQTRRNIQDVSLFTKSLRILLTEKFSFKYHFDLQIEKLSGNINSFSVFFKDLPNFENIRRELSQTLDRIVQERLKTQPSTSTSHRSSGGKLVKFEDESPRHNETHPTKQPSTTIPSRPKDIYTGPSHFHSDDESSQQSETDNNYYQPSKPVPRDDIQPSPRKNIPSAGISALVTGVTKPVTTNNNSTISALVRPKSKLIQSESER